MWKILIFVFGCCTVVTAAVQKNYFSSPRLHVSKGQIGTTAIGSLKNDQTDVSLVMEPDAPWENFIIPAPTAIALLGQLMVIAGKVDFSLTEMAPPGGFKYLRQPGSFRASLVQVSNDGWTAFYNAHTNMDKIQLYMQQVPQHVRSVFEIILQAPQKMVNKLLPVPLQSIADIGRKCVQLSAETETKFLDVMFLLGEILEATESSRGNYDQKLLQVRMELNASTVQKQQLENIGEELKIRQAQVNEQVKKYQDAFDRALREIPTGWKAIAQDFVRAAINLVNYIPQMIFPATGKSSEHSANPQISGESSSSGPDFQTSNILAIARQYFDQLGTMKNVIQKMSNGTVGVNNPSGLFKAFETVLGTFENLLSQYSGSSTGGKVLDAVRRGREVCTQIQNLFKNAMDGTSEGNKQSVTEQLDSLIEEVKPLVAAGAYSSDGMSIQGPSSAPVSSSTFTGPDANARYKAQMNLELLKDAEQRYDQVFDNMMKYQEEMKKLMTRMVVLDMEKVEFTEIIGLIKEGIIILAKIREQWGLLVRFFSLVSVRAEVGLNNTLSAFIRYAQEAQDLIEPGDLTDEDRMFFKDLLCQPAADMHKFSYFLFTLSSTYVDVSHQYIMTRLAGLAKMLVTSDEGERHALLLGLQRDSEQAQSEIKTLAQQRKTNYQNIVQQRIIDAEKYVQQLGGPSASDQAATKRGINAIKVKEQNPSNPFDIDALY